MDGEIAIRIKYAIRDLIFEQLPDMFPHTTLAGPVTAGVDSLILPIVPCPVTTDSFDLDPPSRFVIGARITIPDGSGERTLTVKDVSADGAQLTIEKSTKMGFYGLEHDHAAGAALYANLVAYGPWRPSNPLVLGDPVVSISIYEGQFRPYGEGYGFPSFAAHIQSNRLMTRVDDSIDLEMWLEQQDNGTLRDVTTIVAMLLKHQDLITAVDEAAALQFGPINQMGDAAVTQYGPKPLDEDTWHFVGTARCLVTSEAYGTR